MDTDGDSILMGALSGVLCFLTLESGGMNIPSILKRASIKDLLLKPATAAEAAGIRPFDGA